MSRFLQVKNIRGKLSVSNLTLDIKSWFGPRALYHTFDLAELLAVPSIDRGFYRIFE